MYETRYTTDTGTQTMFKNIKKRTREIIIIKKSEIWKKKTN